MRDIRQAPSWANYLKSIGWQIEKLDNTYIYLKKIPLLGWFAKIQRPEVLETKTIDSIISQYHPFQISIEPKSKTISFTGFRLSKSPSLPTKTIHIDLEKSEKELLKDMSQKTRYNIKLSQKKNTEIIESENIYDFTNFWRENFEKKRFPLFSQQKNIVAMKNAFKENSRILLAKKDGVIVSVLFLLLHNKATYYMYAASNAEGRKNFAPTLLTWTGILISKKKGYKVFDFDGVYDKRFPIKTWAGFTKFKKGFGGKEINYPGRFIRSKFNI